MAGQGRRPEPTRLRVMRGNPSKSAIPKNEVQPVGGPRMPKYLSPAAQEVWKEVIPNLVVAGIATSIDSATLGRYCSLSADFRKYTAEVDAGNDIFITQTGYAQLTPAASMRLKIGPQLLQMEREFGMTASSRAGLSIQEKKADPLDDFLKEA